MKKGVKIAIGIATIGVIGTAGYFLWKKVIKPKISQPELEDEDEEREEVIKQVVEKKKKPSAKKYTTSDADFKQAGIVSGTGKTFFKTFTDLDFKNQKAGNVFRKYVNWKFPSYAKSISLDPSGSHTNAFIKKAWRRLGGVYLAWLWQYTQDKAKKEKEAQAKANAISVGSYVVVNTRGKLTAYEGNPLLKDVAWNKYSAPNGVKYKVVKMGKDAQNGKSILYIFNSADKGNGFTKGRGFQIYESQVKKTTF